MGRMYLNEGWKFTEEFSTDLLALEYDESKLEAIRLPHTCKETPYHYFDESIYQMVTGYRRVLFAEKEWEGKELLFTCEGAGHETTVYVNGKEVYTHHCGYTGFTVNLAKYVEYGRENVIVLKVNSKEDVNQPPFGFAIDYMTFGGVYREVYLEVVERTYIKDVFVKAGAAVEGVATLAVEVEVSKEATNAMIIRGILRKKHGDESKEVFCQTVAEEKFLLSREVTEVESWHVNHPYLYEIIFDLLDAEENVVHSVTTSFGFRTVEFRTDGFYLNGEKFRIRGLNRHQSYPYVGYAMPESMQKQDADILKFELGCNATRNSHYPQSHHFINRCDEIGLLVFMEIPGWQHIGNGDWKKQACVNVEDMIRQYRNHPSIMIWGVRINESQDDHDFYVETNRIAHELDDTRPTGGVRNFAKSELLEDVYTYNDFVHDGQKHGCDPKKKITSDMSKGYLITEYNGHMYPTKPFDFEEHRLEHALRHARVLDSVGREEDISGSFGWCMFDYNTHKDFGSGDRICYHGVTDMFRNPKMAAGVYASYGEEMPVLEVSSSMEIGEHPANCLGPVYIFTNADSVKMYKNDYFIKEYRPEDSAFIGMKKGPILVDDFVGDLLYRDGMGRKQAKLISDALNYVAIHGYQNLPVSLLLKMAKAMIVYKMKYQDMVDYFTKYICGWGEKAPSYRFEAIKDGKVVKTVVKVPMRSAHLETRVSHTKLQEGNTYDVASVRIRALDDHHNLLFYYQEPVKAEVEGPIALIGSDVVGLKGGMGGLYVKTTGEKGVAKLRLMPNGMEPVEIAFEVE